MKVCVGSKTLCISLICLLVSSPVSGDELGLVRSILRGPRVLYPPSQDAEFFDFYAYMITVMPAELFAGRIEVSRHVSEGLIPLR